MHLSTTTAFFSQKEHGSITMHWPEISCSNCVIASIKVECSLEFGRAISCINAAGWCYTVACQQTCYCSVLLDRVQWRQRLIACTRCGDYAGGVSAFRALHVWRYIYIILKYISAAWAHRRCNFLPLHARQCTQLYRAPKFPGPAWLTTDRGR
jgi:hypothetical protein